jgi:hypothetical protein
MKRKLSIIAIALAATLGLGACASDADMASENLSKAADNFDVYRRVVLYNGITDTYTLAVTGKCSLNNGSGDSVTCKMENGEYVKHIFRMGDNMTLFAEQLSTKDVSLKQYKVYFRPSQVIPDIDVR